LISQDLSQVETREVVDLIMDRTKDLHDLEKPIDFIMLVYC